LAKAEKYNIEFKTPDGTTCTVRFAFEGFTGSPTTLTGGPRPFVLREFNTDDDLFKPIRPQMAEIEILTNSSGVTIEDFYADNDSDILVSFTIGLIYYWNGYLLQDDFQENWSDQNHIITVRATEGFGYLKNQQLSDGGLELQGLFTPKDILGYAIAGTSANFFRLREFNNLYHDSMTTTLQSPLDQCYINAKTFATEANQYEDCYTVIEKINRSWNQTIFMWRNYWVIMRMEELYTPPTNNLRGLYFNLGGPYAINTRYDINVSSTSDVKSIEPGMIKMIRKKTKQDEVDFGFEAFDEAIANESFIRGTLVSTAVSSKEYTLQDWTFTTAYGTNGVREIYDSTLYGGLIERYAWIKNDGEITSTYINVNYGERLDFSVEIQSLYDTIPTYNSINIGRIWIESSPSNNYYLQPDGSWEYNPIPNPLISIDDLSGQNIVSTDWNSMEINSVTFPTSGKLYVQFWFTAAVGFINEVRFKNLNVTILPSFDDGGNRRNVTGVSSKYIKTTDVNNNSLNNTYLDDGFSDVFKGTIFESDGVTRTNAQWSRFRFPGESFGFRRQNATAYWEHNRVNRTKIDATFYGLFNGSANEPIGLINTVIFTDDDPDKVYAIANMKEIDFSSGIWQATLEEVYDTNRDTLTSQNFAASWTLGTYASPTKIPATLTTSGGFSIQSNTDIRWDGGASITKNITASINGTLQCASYPTTITMTLKLNSTAIKTQTYPVNVANQSFTFNMSPATSTTIAPGDIITLNITSATSITVAGGTISIPSGQQGLTYDPYYDEFIQQ